MAGASEPDPVLTKQQRIAELAKQAPQMGFTSLNHHLDLRWLGEAYDRTRKDGAPGVDGQTADDYVLSLRDNLESLLDRAKSGTYRAPPVRRVRIPKERGTRPVRSGFRRWRTRSCSGRSSWHWSRSTSRTS
jgi:RNA-directed DNA polymerase